MKPKRLSSSIDMPDSTHSTHAHRVALMSADKLAKKSHEMDHMWQIFLEPPGYCLSQLAADLG